MYHETIKLEPNLILKRCPHCKVDNPNLQQVTNFYTNEHNGKNQRAWGIYQCVRCGGVVTASSDKLNNWVLEVFPAETWVDDSIPNKANAFLNQAIETLHAPSGSIMLSASAVDAMLKEKGLKTGSLYSRIDKASKDHLITEEMATWAHEIRLDANDERHADDEAELPKMEDAKRCVDFALALGEFLFVLPSKIERGLEDATKKE